MVRKGEQDRRTGRKRCTYGRGEGVGNVGRMCPGKRADWIIFAHAFVSTNQQGKQIG
jgi:hypothetical protein